MSPRNRTPNNDSTDNATAVADQPVAVQSVGEAAANGTSFAERVGEKTYEPLPDPFGIASDNQAGVRLFESKKDRQMAIMFGDGKTEDKPSQAVLDAVKAAGYRWNPSERVWTHAVRFETARSTRIKAERLYEQVRQIIRNEKGIVQEPGIPF